MQASNMARIVSAKEYPSTSNGNQDSSRRRYSWALDMQYPLEMGKLSRLSGFGTGIGKELQIPEWDFKSVIDTKPLGRLFLQKNPRDSFTVELKREMVDNDRRLKSNMTQHRKSMHRENRALEQTMRKHERPYVCHRGNIKSRFGEEFDKMPSSLRANKFQDQESTSQDAVSQSNRTAAPMTVVEAETVISEQYVVCHTCKKTYKESKNTETSCRYHYGPIIAVFGGMCQNCGMLDYTDGCVVGFHSRKNKLQPPNKRISMEAPHNTRKTQAENSKTHYAPPQMQDEGIQME